MSTSPSPPPSIDSSVTAPAAEKSASYINEKNTKNLRLVWFFPERICEALLNLIFLDVET